MLVVERIVDICLFQLQFSYIENLFTDNDIFLPQW